MRQVMPVVVLSLFAIVASGCFLDMLGATAIGSGMQAESANVMMNQLDNARQTTSDIEITSAVQAYRAEYGEPPASLEDLVPEYFTAVPTQPDGTSYYYDPATGMVSDTPLAGGVSVGSSDQEKMEQLARAVYNYSFDTGAYPTGLSMLVPGYISDLPKTASGLDFWYDAQYGMVYHPDPANIDQPQTAQTPVQQPMRQPVVSGGGMVGEAMTGIAIQQELNGMSNAGSSAAGSRLRQQARDLGERRQ